MEQKKLTSLQIQCIMLCMYANILSFAFMSSSKVLNTRRRKKGPPTMAMVVLARVVFLLTGWMIAESLQTSCELEKTADGKASHIASHFYGSSTLWRICKKRNKSCLEHFLGILWNIHTPVLRLEHLTHFSICPTNTKDWESLTLQKNPLHWLL